MRTNRRWFSFLLSSKTRRISSNVQGRCCKPQAEVFQPQQGGTEGFSGDQAGGEHGAKATAGQGGLCNERLISSAYAVKALWFLLW